MFSYWRNPTAFEIKWGSGDIHYFDFPEFFCCKEDGTPKCWLKFNNLRYYLVK